MNFTAAGRQSGFGEEYSSGGGNPPPPSAAAEMGMIDREHMFDKVVTPSDVGKLNRLVIPKQHAERFFPLDSGSNEKGLLLNFEDRNGKPWRFRYSYWNSSQSYVMTKGWSRFVKEKKLDAGDVVSFHRGLLKDRLFIDWRRRPCPPPPALPTANPWAGTFLMQNPHHYQYQYHHPYPAARGGGGSIMYLRGAPQFPVHNNNNNNNNNQLAVFESVPVVQGKAAAKRLRLFGVNMDCPISAEDEEEEEDVLVMSSSSPSATSTTMFPSSHHHQYQYHRLPAAFDSSSSSSSSSLARLRHNDGSDDKGKGSMSLDLDI